MKKHLPLIILGIILLGWAVFINSLSNQFIFAPSRDLQPVDPALREVNMPVQFGHALNGLYLPPKAGKPVILFFHGNRYNVTHFQDFAKIYSKYGYGILLFDYRGYGEPKFVGLDNFVRVFTRDPVFWDSVVNTFIYVGGKHHVKRGLGIENAENVAGIVRANPVAEGGHMGDDLLLQRDLMTGDRHAVQQGMQEILIHGRSSFSLWRRPGRLRLPENGQKLGTRIYKGKRKALACKRFCGIPHPLF